MKTAELEEPFFDSHFEYGDDSDTVRANLKKAHDILQKSLDEVERITELMENGECFDESEAILAFQTLALANNFSKQFESLLSSEECCTEK